MKKITFKSNPAKNLEDLTVVEHRKIGEGAFGKVYIAKDMHDVKNVFALKKIPRFKFDKSGESIQNLLSEIAILG
jgi:serine/threonine protein kinase